MIFAVRVRGFVAAMAVVGVAAVAPAAALAQSGDDDPYRWLMDMQQAFSDLDYDGVFSFYGGDDLASLRVVHVKLGGVQRERVLLFGVPNVRDRDRSDNTVCRIDQVANRVDLVATGPGTYEACTPRRICYAFADGLHGKLTSVVDPSGNSVSLTYDADRKQLPLDRVIVEVGHDKVHADDLVECTDDHHPKSGRIDLFTRSIKIDGDLDDDTRRRLRAMADLSAAQRGGVPVHVPHPSDPDGRDLRVDIHDDPRSARGLILCLNDDTETVRLRRRVRGGNNSTLPDGHAHTMGMDSQQMAAAAAAAVEVTPVT